MNSRCLLLLALASFGASAAPLVSTASVGFGNVNAGVGPTVSETVVTPYHRTDAVSTPCGHSVVRTTAVPIVPYGLSSGVGFLGGSAGLYPGVVGSGFAGTCAGVYPGVLAGGFAAGTGAAVYPGVVANGLVGTGAVAYPGVVAGGLVGTAGGAFQGVGGVAGAGILGAGCGLYP